MWALLDEAKARLYPDSTLSSTGRPRVLSAVHSKSLYELSVVLLVSPKSLVQYIRAFARFFLHNAQNGFFPEQYLRLVRTNALLCVSKRSIRISNSCKMTFPMVSKVIIQRAD